MELKKTLTFDEFVNEQFYGFTYKKLGKELPTEEDYMIVLQRLSSKGEVVDFVFEEDSKNRLHIHGTIKLKHKNPYFKSLMCSGFHSHYELITDMDGWNRYIQKETIQSIDNKTYMF